MTSLKSIFPLVIAATVGAGIISCGGNNQEKDLTKSGLDRKAFQNEYNGKATDLYVLTNSNGLEACFTNFGGRLVSMMVPDRDGRMHDVVLGFDSVTPYFPENNQTDFGATIGRYANRINEGRMIIDGDTVILPQNNFGHCLHGGPAGWQYQVWDAVQPDDSTLVLSLVSPDGDNGFPGEVKAEVTYVLRSDNALDVTYTATTDRPTVVNMTQHSYFNLSGDPSNTVHNHLLTLNASNFTPTDTTEMPTGEIRPVAGTPMDFTTAKAIGLDIAADDEQIRGAHGFDHNWVLDTEGSLDRAAARLESPETGIVMEVFTNEPGLQAYSGNFLDGTMTGKGGKAMNCQTAICLETQKYPDTPNHPEWPSATLNPGEKYISRCIFRFSTAE